MRKMRKKDNAKNIHLDVCQSFFWMATGLLSSIHLLLLSKYNGVGVLKLQINREEKEVCYFLNTVCLLSPILQNERLQHQMNPVSGQNAISKGVKTVLPNKPMNLHIYKISTVLTTPQTTFSHLVL